MINILYNTLAFAGLFSTLIGLYVILHVFIKPMKPPADTSNRIAHLKLFHLACSKSHLFVEAFPFLKNDVEDNLK
jgi:hypothetical protein